MDFPSTLRHQGSCPPQPEPRIFSRAQNQLLAVVNAKLVVHKSELRRILGISWGTVTFHLKKMEESRSLHIVQTPARTLVVSNKISHSDLKLAQLCSHPAQQKVLLMFKEMKQIKTADYANRVGVSQRAAQYHFSKLHWGGVITKNSNSTTYSLALEKESSALLKKILEGPREIVTF